MARFFSENYLE